MPHERIVKQAILVQASRPELARAEFGRLCQYVIEAVDQGAMTVQQGAYRICGTAARMPVALTPDERRLIEIAGNLELPPEKRDQSLGDWHALRSLVIALFMRA
jgi:hypothetical protein